MDQVAYGVAVSRTHLNDFHFHIWLVFRINSAGGVVVLICKMVRQTPKFNAASYELVPNTGFLSV